VDRKKDERGRNQDAQDRQNRVCPEFVR